MAVPLLVSALASCSALDRPSALDQRAAILQYQASAREARADADMGAQQQALEQDRVERDTRERQQAERLAAGVAAQQAAKASLQPALHTCLLGNARRLASASTEGVDRIVEADLRLCRPAIVALARSVELAHLSSDGLADEIAARLRPEVKRAVTAARSGQPVVPGEF